MPFPLQAGALKPWLKPPNCSTHTYLWVSFFVPYLWGFPCFHIYIYIMWVFLVSSRKTCGFPSTGSSFHGLLGGPNPRQGLWGGGKAEAASSARRGFRGPDLLGTKAEAGVFFPRCRWFALAHAKGCHRPSLLANGWVFRLFPGTRCGGSTFNHQDMDRRF